MEMDIRMLAAIISAVVAIVIAVVNHFIVEPMKAKKQWKKQQLSNFYAPAYGLAVAKVNLVRDYCLDKKVIGLGATEDTLGVLKKDYFAEFIVKNSGYASQEFLEVWIGYIGKFPSATSKESTGVVITLVKDYNRLRKELGYEYNKEELESGIPEVIKELRE